MKQIQFHRLPAIQPQGQLSKGQVKTSNHQFETTFQEVLAEKALKMSKHAAQRLEERAISFTDVEWMHIEEKVSEAKGKGVHSPLVLTKEAAMIISAKNNTVITAMNRKEATAQIFTNIDGTIIL